MHTYQTFTGFIRHATYPAILAVFGLLIWLQPAVSRNLPFNLGGASHFSRQLDAMRWQYHTDIILEEGSFQLEVDNLFRSRLYLSDGKAQSIQDENQLRLAMRRQLNDEWALSAEAGSYHFTTTNVRQQTAHLGAIITPFSRLGFEHAQLAIMAGMMTDRRSNRNDQGWSALLRAFSEPFQASGFLIHPEAELHVANISPRSHRNMRLSNESQYRDDELMMQSALILSSGTRESYQPSSFFNRNLTNIIESIRNDTTAFDIRVRFPVTEKMGLQVDLYTLSNVRTLESRPVAEDTRETIFDSRTHRRELLLRTSTDYRIRRSQLALGMTFSYMNRESRLINTADIPDDQVRRRNEVLRNSNFDQSRFELFTRNRVRLTPHHEIMLEARSGILRYDTPEQNLDDRDELNYQVLLTNRHVFSPWFDLTVRTGGEATHYVYLSGTRSIENNWRRTIRLAPEIRWEPHERLLFRNELLVRANYTVEDYQLEGRPKNDQSSREFAFRSRLDVTLADHWQFETALSRSELRIGRLYWKSFQETPTDTLVTYNLEAMVVHRPGRHHIGVGGRFFVRRDYLPQAVMTIQVENEQGQAIPVSRRAPGYQMSYQFGPSIDIRLQFVSGNRIIINGWLQRQEVWRRLYTAYPDDLKEAFLKEERRKTVRIYPNLEIRAVFDF